MIAFATLWLGIVAGPLPVVVLAGPEVARVELRLDGVTVAEMSGPPWAATIDLGGEIAPHELVAVARDAAGAPLGEARQLLNMPRPWAEIEVAVSRVADGTEVRLAWAGTGTAEPRSVRGWLDGEPLPGPSDPHLIRLPSFPDARARLLRVEADFPTGVVSREVVLGGDITAAMDIELTAVPLEIGDDEPPADGLRLEAPGHPLTVISLEKGLADLVAVVDPAARPTLRRLLDRAGRPTETMGQGPWRRAARTKTVTRFLAPLREDHRLRLLLPVSERDTRFELFPVSPELPPGGAGLLAYLALETGQEAGATRLADAVALAATSAASEGRRRAVVLVLAPGTADASLYSAAAVRRYLARMRVPIAVWVTGKPSEELLADWGDARRTDSVTSFERAARELGDRLDRQRVAWVEGRYLPDRVFVADGEHRARVAGASAFDLRTTRAELEAAADAAAAEEEAARLAAEAEARTAARAAREAAAAALVPAGLGTRPFGPFQVATDLRDEWLVGRLAEVAGALAPSWRERFGLAVEPAGTVLLFAQERGFRGWLAEHRSGGSVAAADRALEGYAVSGTAALHAGAESPDEVAAVLVHELAHLLTRDAVGRELPPWLEEGIAEELAMSRLDREGRVVSGSLRTNRRVLALGAGPGRANQVERMVSGPGAALVMLVGTPGARVPLGELLAATPAAFASLAGRQERYATAGFFVRFLLGEEGRAGRFRAFLAAAAAGGATDAPALEAALGRSLAELEREFVGWLRVTAMTSAG